MFSGDSLHAATILLKTTFVNHYQNKYYLQHSNVVDRQVDNGFQITCHNYIDKIG